jgi:hypothetical protein
MSDIKDRLLAACNGHPNAGIPWPHRLLHDAIDRIAELEKAATEVVECGVDGMAYDRRVVLDALAALLPGGGE